MADERSNTPQAARTGTGGAAQIRWDDSTLKSSYANTCNVSSTREEIMLVFGINHALPSSLSPFTAKRLADLRANIIREYEARFGPLGLETRRPGEASA